MCSLYQTFQTLVSIRSHLFCEKNLPVVAEVIIGTTQCKRTSILQPSFIAKNYTVLHKMLSFTAEITDEGWLMFDEKNVMLNILKTRLRDK